MAQRKLWLTPLVFLALTLLFLGGGWTSAAAATLSLKSTIKAFNYNGAAGSIAYRIDGATPGQTLTITAAAVPPEGEDVWIEIDPLSLTRTVTPTKSVVTGSVKYRVPKWVRSSAQPRQATISVDVVEDGAGAASFTVTQSGAPCKVAVSPASATVSPDGGEGAFTVTANPGCAWTAAATGVTWIAGLPVSDPGSGEPVFISYVADWNQTGKTRKATIAVTTEALPKAVRKNHVVNQKKSSRTETLSGVAAAGAPIIGTVTVKDSSNPPLTKTARIAADGQYSIDVRGMTAPFALRADGTVGGRLLHLYSGATMGEVGGTVNITPFTDLILANIAADLAENYYESGAFSSMTQQQVNDAELALRDKLQPLLSAVGVEQSLDLLRSSFSADHTKLDGILDIVRVEVDPDTLTAQVRNILNDHSITADVNSGSYAGEFSLADSVSAADGLSALQQIVAGFQSFSSLFASGLPAPNNATLRGLFDAATFRNDGIDLDTFLSELTSDPSLVGIQFSNISVVSLDPVGGTGEVAFDVMLRGIVMRDAPNRFYMVRSGDKWLMQGDQRIAHTWVETRAFRYVSDNNARMQTGLGISVRDDGQNGVDYAIVTGPGFPEQGVVLVKTMEHDSFRIFDGVNVTDSNFVELDEAGVNALPETGAEYTFALWSAAGTPENLADDVPLAQYSVQILARPVKPSELSAERFATVIAPSVPSWAAFNGGTVRVQWTIPSGCRSDYVYSFLSGPNWNVEEEKTLAPDATSTNLTITAQGQITQRNLEVGVMDDVARSFITVLY